MDIEKNGLHFPLNDGFTNAAVNFGDTTLRLDCFGHGGNGRALLGSDLTDSQVHVTPLKSPEDDCGLMLGLIPSPNSGSISFSGNKWKGLTDMLDRGLSSDGDSILKLGLSCSNNTVSNILDHPASRENSSIALCYSKLFSDGNRLHSSVLDEGSTSAKRSGGHISSLLLTPRMKNTNWLESRELIDLDAKSNQNQSQLSSDPSAVSDYSVSTISDPKGATKSSDNRINNPKRCNFLGCTKGARGATGLCIGHGGGQRCQKRGCTKGAESRTAYCKSHGGGIRCLHLGCTKSAEGKTDYCIAHGGGRRCEYPGGCSKAARGKSGFCIRHGGGKRCKVEGCTRSAEGQIGLCISHGGGRRCQFQGCSKGAQGSTMFCKAHGGGKRCTFMGCTKGAEGSTPLCKAHGGGKRCMFDGGGICPKSVHGGTNFCVAHGGGKRCSVPGCTKSARGRTDFCVRHGGGKRCKVENCGKSAQGSTDFCKAHGGGKRCIWGEGKCEKFARGKGGLCAAHSSMLNGCDKSKRGMIAPGLFHGIVPAAHPALSASTALDNTNSSSAVSAISDSTDSLEKPAKRQQLIPPQVLVPLSMRTLSPYSNQSSSESENRAEKSTPATNGCSTMGNSLEMVIPEGRVHGGGGGLLSLLRLEEA